MNNWSQGPHNSKAGGFTVNTAPGGTGNWTDAPNTGMNWGTATPPPFSFPPGSVQQTQQNPQEEEQRQVKSTTPGQQLATGGMEIFMGLVANVGQIVTSFSSVLLSEAGAILTAKGWWGGMGALAHDRPWDLFFAFLVSFGAQTLIHAGCQRIKRESKLQGQLAEMGHPSKVQLFIEIMLHEKLGTGLTIIGALIDTVGDLYFTLTVGVPFVLFILIAILMNGLATWVLYDGLERYHIGWLAHYQHKTWKWAVRQAALELARSMAARSQQQPSR